jgi:type I restriction enzyme, S subunit
MNPELLIAHFNRISDAPGAIPRLRRFILDLAVRGKLVELDPADEPASQLLNQIRAEKARLVKQGNIQRREQLVAPGADHSQFVTPRGWILTTLGEVAHKITDGAHKTPTYVDDGVPFISVKDFSGGKLDFSYTRLISPQEHTSLYKRCDPRRGDILIGRIGTLGKAVLVDTDREFSLFVSVGLIRFSQEFIAPLFFRLVLNSPLLENDYNRIKVGGGTHTNKLNLGDLHTIMFPLPPLAEQHRIVAKVDELMALCDRLQASREEQEQRRHRLAALSLHRLSNGSAPAKSQDDARFYLDHLRHLTIRPQQVNRLRQTIRNLAVRGCLVPQVPDDEPASDFLKRTQSKKSANGPFPIPNSWAWVSVGQIGEARLGKMLDKAKNKGTPRRYLRNVNVRWFDFDLSDVFKMRFEDDEIEEFALRDGDVLICEGGEPGRAAVWDEREEKIYFQKAIHRVRFPDSVDSHFFVNALRESSDSGRLSGYFTGIAIKHLTGKGLSSFVFPLAPLGEQHRIIARVKELMVLCDRLEAQLTKAQDATSYLLESVLYHALNDSVESDTPTRPSPQIDLLPSRIYSHP